MRYFIAVVVCFLILLLILDTLSEFITGKLTLVVVLGTRPVVGP